MFTYTAYGLGIFSEIALPGFAPADVNQDVSIRIERDPQISPGSLDGSAPIRLGADESILWFDSLATFLIRNGNEIIIYLAPDADLQLIQNLAVGTLMAIVLFQRGFLVLHASAVEVAGRALLLLGASGSGKSSLAAALCSRGHSLITDDVAGIGLNGRAHFIHPGYPQLKLSPEAAASLGLDPQELILLHEREENRGYRLKHGFIEHPIPLGCIYVLNQAKELGIHALGAQEAVVELVRHSVPTRFSQPADPAHFLKCVQLSNQVHLYRFNKSNSIHMLPDLARLLEEHFMQNVSLEN